MLAVQRLFLVKAEKILHFVAGVEGKKGKLITVLKYFSFIKCNYNYAWYQKLQGIRIYID